MKKTKRYFILIPLLLMLFSFLSISAGIKSSLITRVSYSHKQYVPFSSGIPVSMADVDICDEDETSETEFHVGSISLEYVSCSAHLDLLLNDCRFLFSNFLFPNTTSLYLRNSTLLI